MRLPFFHFCLLHRSSSKSMATLEYPQKIWKRSAVWFRVRENASLGIFFTSEVLTNYMQVWVLGVALTALGVIDRLTARYFLADSQYIFNSTNLFHVGMGAWRSVDSTGCDRSSYSPLLPCWLTIHFQFYKSHHCCWSRSYGAWVARMFGCLHEGEWYMFRILFISRQRTEAPVNKSQNWKSCKFLLSF